MPSTCDEGTEPVPPLNQPTGAPPSAVAAAAAAAPHGSRPDAADDDDDGADADAGGGGGGPPAKRPRPQPQPAKPQPSAPPADPVAARREALAAARTEAARIRASELGGFVPAVDDPGFADPLTAAARRQAAAAAAEAAHFPHRVVAARRPPKMAAARLELPISGLEADIMEAVAAHDVVVLAGETGCGKTTQVRWISKASAMQRAGRAGRTCPGHTYRLFSSAHFNDTFPEHTPPEIVNTSLEGVVLVMKSMGVDKVHNFPFPTPPDPAALRAAHSCLEALCALEPGSGAAAAGGGGGGGALTDIGRAMAAFPISPRHARMLLEVLKWHKSPQSGAASGADGGGGGDDADPGTSGGALAVSEVVARRAGRALPYAVALAAALSVESPFIHIDTVVGSTEEGTAGAEGEEEGEDGPGEEAPSWSAADGGRRRLAAQALAAALSVESPFIHIDTVVGSTEEGTTSTTVAWPH
ncbi:putative ATP-dependent RNA [Tetrabaena socialis]|uniref:Putative ATP-dependent RNA n=1 Tax=Tetrabaena socialis TaxID=47790 RepID=A0A2J7ZJT7_9CHLO|nr:putative ATP-dependent RNA [Tetrabaena socialis]|eukprot:PNH00523.1 putative ATP-dependent RNA [Tetrabaena socialis]